MPRSASPDRNRNHDRSRRRDESPRRRDDSPRRRNDSSPSPQSRHSSRNDRPRRRDDNRSLSRERNHDGRWRKDDRRSESRSNSRSPIREEHSKAESSRRNRDRSRSRSSESSASGRSASENRSRRKHERKRKRSRSIDRSESSSDSDSESEGERRKHRHKKKRHHDSDEKKLKKNKEKRKHKKDKKSKHKKDKKQNLGAVTNQWGTHGIIHEADMFTKEQEFHAWLLEVKNVSPETLKPAKMKEMFQGFMEDYNTATMPHEKFYNLERWETRQRAIRMGEKPPDEEGKVNLLNDEEQLRLQRRQQSVQRNATIQSTFLSSQQIEDLRRVQSERIAADRMRKMGLKPKDSMGIRYE